MGKLAINKSSLKQLRDQLALYERFLPSLDLKRQQLLAELKRARERLADAEAKLQTLGEASTDLLKPLGSTRMELEGLVTLERLELGEENIVGARLPVLREIRFAVARYSTLARPFWVDFLVEQVRAMATARIEWQVERERLTRLEFQVRRVTQRVNLFDKVLIPQARESIKRIRIGLAEQERNAVVRSKLAKRKGE